MIFEGFPDLFDNEIEARTHITLFRFIGDRTQRLRRLYISFPVAYNN